MLLPEVIVGIVYVVHCITSPLINLPSPTVAMQEYGRQTLGASERPKRVTVFLNAAAGKGKAKNLFEQNAEPVLHLAGFEVTVVKTDREGQAKELLGALDNVDMIVVAGGDGTLLEVVTGMLRRDDQASFSKIPIGIIPLGKSNTLSKIIFPDFEDHVRCITSAALAIVKGSTIPVDVIQITGTFGKPVFALNELRWGEFRNAKANTSRFWYFGPMRMFASFIRSTFKPWPPTHNATLRFTPAVQRPPLPPEGGTPPPTRPPFLFRLIARIRGLWPTHATEETESRFGGQDGRRAESRRPGSSRLPTDRPT
uniref:Acylglycerol kinase, mitochondrial n=1 Tax=Eptatretus burgeri TaxID=7764 RepID=A0A8C4QQ73_EPTBU